MDKNLILWPVLALMGWTLLVLLLVAYRRFSAGFAGQVSFEDFRQGESDTVPASVSLPNRAFINLLEVPVLFYCLSILVRVTDSVDLFCIVMAWVYVWLRIGHSLIYLTYNKVVHRFIAFTASNLIVLALWLKLLLMLAGSSALATR